MAKSIAQQIKQKVQERVERDAQSGEQPAVSTDARNFVASASPGSDVDMGVAYDQPQDAAPITNDAPEEPQSEQPEAQAGNEPAENVEETSAPDGAEASTGEQSAEPQNATEHVEPEYEDVEFTDGATGYEYKFRARKGEGDFLRNGYQRRDDYDRKLSRLGRFQQMFQEKIESGYMDRVAPIFNAIDTDPELSKAVSQLYQQRMIGAPLAYGVEQYQQQLQQLQQQQAQPQYQQQTQATEYEDPYVAEHVQRLTSPLTQQIQALQEQLQQRQQQDDQFRTQQTQAQANQQRELAEWQQIHQEMTRRYPNEFKGTQEDFPRLQQLNAYANQSGWTRDTHGFVGRILSAKMALDQDTPRQQAASQSIAAAEQQANERAREASRQVAAGTVVGNQSSPPPAPPRLKSLKGKDGKALPLKEQVRRATANAVTKANRAQ